MLKVMLLVRRVEGLPQTFVKLSLEVSLVGWQIVRLCRKDTPGPMLTAKRSQPWTLFSKGVLAHFYKPLKSVIDLGTRSNISHSYNTSALVRKMQAGPLVYSTKLFLPITLWDRLIH
ncbi:hypothetical protein J6590_073567 [Homalodisca vitripennis]|nr:hypothetical protein J6590_073567 [Homalodisca vitripennis]